MSMGKGGFQGPNTRAPGGGGMNQAGNPISGGMPTQFNTGGAQPQPGFGGIANAVGNFAAPALNQIAPGAGNNLGPQLGRAFGMPGQQPGFGRFQPGGMIPPAGARQQVRGVVADPRRQGRYNPQPVIGNPRQVNPGQGPMQPGQPGGGKSGFQGPMTRYDTGPIDDMGELGNAIALDGNGNY